ncbi:MAG TPA: phytanoyl-CoA dioxygenase family protein [Labilithrix sp.]|nr:phytanoyl-CoA dioxygenase family protein [Labilithrix sp.]
MSTALAKLQAVSLERVARSVRFRAMNMLARFEPVRAITAFGAGTPREDIRSPIFPGASARQLSTDLKRDGIAFGLTLPPAVLEEIQAWAKATPRYGNICKEWGYHDGDRAAAEAKAGSHFTVGHYFNTSDCPAVQRLVDDPLLAELARSYVGPRAKYISTHMWWSYANDVPEADRNAYAQQFHFDLDDYRFMKFFFYLTDVDLDSGPHTYMRGTHTAKKMKDLFPMRRFTDREVHDQWGKEREVKVTGPAGSGFIVDTFGIHKGTPPRTRDRLVIELEWGQRYYGFGNDVVPAGELALL